MKFIAMLKYSFREALDGWVIYLMLIGSLLVILLVASISFTPLTVQQDVESFPKTLNLVTGFLPPGQPKPSYAIENFQQTNDAKEPWNGDYAFDFVIKFASSADLEAAKKAHPELVLNKQMVTSKFRSEEFFYLDHVQVEEVPSADQVRYHITTRGTKVKNRLAWKCEPAILFGVNLPFSHVSIEGAVYDIEKWLVNKIGALLACVVGIIITAFFVPNLMRKGSIDLICSKPVRYWQVLLYKYVGGLAFMFVLTSVTVVGIWVVLGLRTGIWGTGFLFLIPAILFFFAILYSISVLMAALTRNAIVAILVTFVVWGIFYGNGVLHSMVESQRRFEEMINRAAPDEDSPVREGVRATGPSLPGWLMTGSDIAHAVLPRTSDLDDLCSKLVSD